MKFRPGDRVKVDSPLCKSGTIDGFDLALGGWRVYSDVFPASAGGLPYCFEEEVLTLLDDGSRPTPKPTRKKLVEVVEQGRRFYAMRET